jgi:hypothetical protein
MPCFKNGESGLLEVIGPRPVLLRGGLAFVLGVLVAGCSADSASTPGGGTGNAGGQGVIGAAGSGGGDPGGLGAGGGGAGGDGENMVGGGAGASGAGGADGAGVGGQGGGSGTTTIETCTGVAPSGIGVPAGTVVTVSTADDTDPATNAIDGDIVDEWSTGTVTGWITLTFPAPVMIGAVLMHADAKPANNEMFTLSTSTSTIPLASFSAQVLMAPGTLLPEIRIPPALYSDITITVNAGASWVGINEIWLLPAPTCP